MIKELMHGQIFLANLSKMYACDERFKKNIDRSGEGTAEFAAEAIDLFCNKK